MNKLITILLLSTVTCFADNKFVRGKFVSGAMPLYVAPLPDLIANGVNIELAVGGTYQYNNIIITNFGSIQIVGNSVQWTTIICNNLKVYDMGGENFTGIYLNPVTYYYATNVTKTAVDGQYLSASLPAHAVNPNGMAGGDGGFSTYSDGYSAYLQTGGNGGEGYDAYNNTQIGPSSGGGWGGNGMYLDYYPVADTTCGYNFYNAGGGGGGGGISKGLLYLRVKSTFTDTSGGLVSIDATGQGGGNGADTAESFIDNADYIYDSNGGDGGAGGSGGVVVQRIANGTYMNAFVDGGTGGLGGILIQVSYNNACIGQYGGNPGNDGFDGNAGTSTHITP
jgi:hypothetical protein